MRIMGNVGIMGNMGIMGNVGIMGKSILRSNIKEDKLPFPNIPKPILGIICLRLVFQMGEG